jgi:hypothetical protein
MASVLLAEARGALQQADAAAEAAAAEAAMARAATQGAEARTNRAEQAAQRNGASDAATDRWLAAWGAQRTVEETSREAEKAALGAAARAAAVRATAEAEGVDLRSAKRKREDEAATQAAARAAVADVVTDLITAVDAHERADPFWIDLPFWYKVEGKVRFAQTIWAEVNLELPEAREAEIRAEWLACAAVNAERAEMRIRHISWDDEQQMDPAVLALARRLDAGEDPYDHPPEPTEEEIDAAGEEGFDALFDAWGARDDALWAEVEPHLPRAQTVVRERRLARKPWAAALTERMRALEGRTTGDYRRGYQRFQRPWGGRTRSGMPHPWARGMLSE